jgi:phage-related protein
MGSEFTSYDYVDAGERNVVYEWLHSEDVPKAVRAKFTNWLQHLEATPIGQWQRPQVDTLTGYCGGLFEVRVSQSHQQYRILGSHMGADRTPTLMHCFIKPDDKVSEKDCDHALLRKAQVEADPNKHRVEHDYG